MSCKKKYNIVNLTFDKGVDFNEIGKRAMANVIQEFFWEAASHYTEIKILKRLKLLFDMKFKVKILDLHNILITRK